MSCVDYDTCSVGTKAAERAREALDPAKRARGVLLQEQGLLDVAAIAIVVDLPTSGGKTLLAQFRMLQALNQFDIEKAGSLSASGDDSLVDLIDAHKQAPDHIGIVSIRRCHSL